MSSPILSVTRGDRISQVGRQQLNYDEAASKDGVINATLILLSICTVTALAVIWLGLTVSPGLASLANLIGGGGLIASTVAMLFSRSLRSGDKAKVMGIILAFFQGMMIGGFTFFIGNTPFDGTPGWILVGQALMGTTVLFFVALFLYRTGVIRVSSGFTKFMVFAISGFAALYGVNFVITLVTGHNFLMSEGPLPIIIGVAAIVLGTLSLIQDFNIIDEMVEAGSDKKYEWALATAVTSSLVWLYMEILRLLFLLNRNN